MIYKTRLAFVFCVFAISNLAFSQIVINEIMPAPEGDEPEWIELYNCSGETVLLSGFSIADLKSAKDLPEFQLPAGGYATVAKDSADFFAARTLPPEAIFVEASMPGFNNTQDAAVLINEGGVSIDSLFYDMDDGEKGKSFERVRCDEKPLADNLKLSEDPEGATPGEYNSVSPRAKDLGIVSVAVNPGEPAEFITISVKNYGREVSAPSPADLSYSGIVLKTFEIPSLQPDEIYESKTGFAEIKDTLKNPGRYELTAAVSFTEDANPENDEKVFDIYLPYPENCLTINEILFDCDDDSEFLEIFNQSEFTINLKEWRIKDAATLDDPDGGWTADEDFFIKPGALAAAYWDEDFIERFEYLRDSTNVFYYKSSMNLNSRGDFVYLIEPNGEICDSLEYLDDWHEESLFSTKNISLEKINPTLDSEDGASWSSCGDSRGATPAEPNSLSRPINPDGALAAEPNPFSPRSTRGENFCVVSFRLPFRQGKYKAVVFDANGRKIRILKNAEFSGSEGSFAWDGKNSEGYALPPGAYPLMLEAVDQSSGEVFYDKIAIVIGN